MPPQLQNLVDELAEELQRSVVIDDADCRLLVSSRHYGDEDPMRIAGLIARSNPPEVVSYLRSLGITSWREPRRVPGRPEMGFESRLCVPLRYNGELVGLLFLIDTVPVRDDELTILHSAAPQLSELLRRDWADADRQATEIEPHLHDLVGSDPGSAAVAVTELRLLGHLPAGFALTAMLVLPSERTTRSQDRELVTGVRRAARLVTDGPILTAPTEDGALAIIAGREAKAAGSAWHSLIEHLSLKGLPRSQVVAVGGVVSDPVELAVSFQQARAGARAVRAGVVSSPAEYDNLGVFGLLSSMAPAGLPPSWASALLRRLDTQVSGEFATTLELFLDHGGDALAVADEMHIHRSSVYYRLSRVEDLLGVSLSDGRTRLELHLWLKLRRLAGPNPD
ncbi:helix-turn-helix domain-containing protein [Rhodococcus sp. NPDC056960]|uniref:helix-turn-helix domain-containing protein n=1 Tax=Rhodococcus sp. NPDC056960 TaxID=3345982 RepID=UPI00362BC1A4